VFTSFFISLSVSLSVCLFSVLQFGEDVLACTSESIRSSKNFNPPASDTLLVTYIFCKKAKNDYKLARARARAKLASMAITIARRANKYFVRGVKKRTALDLLLPTDNNFESPTNPPRPRASRRSAILRRDSNFCKTLFDLPGVRRYVQSSALMLSVVCFTDRN